MDVTIYRGRGDSMVLVPACMPPPRVAAGRHGPLRAVATIGISGATLGEHWESFADQMEHLSFAVMEPGLVLGLLGENAEPAAADLRLSPASSLPG